MTEWASARWQATYGTLDITTDWRENMEVWTADRLVLEFWSMTDSYATRITRGWAQEDPSIDDEELRGVALISLVENAQVFHAWCGDNDVDPANRQAFWGLVKKRVKWDLAKVLERKMEKHSSTDLVDENGNSLDIGSVFTQLRVNESTSMLHRDLADAIPVVLGRRSQMVVALRYFENLPSSEVDRLIEGDAQKILSRCTRRVLAWALRETTSTELPPLQAEATVRDVETPALVAWVAINYGVDIDTYLAYVAKVYHADVSYIVDIIERAHGIRHKTATSTCSAFVNGSEDWSGKRAPKGARRCSLDRGHSGPHSVAQAAS